MTEFLVAIAIQLKAWGFTRSAEWLLKFSVWAFCGVSWNRIKIEQFDVIREKGYKRTDLLIRAGKRHDQKE